MGFLDKILGRKNLELREPRFAGLKYPADAAELDERLDALLADSSDEAPGDSVRALVVAQGDYDFAGPTMARGWSSLRGQQVERVVLVGSSRLVPFRGLAVTGYDGFATPLGPVVSDRPALEALVQLDEVRAIEPAFDPEASLEVQLPFLQKVLGDVRLVPLLVGDATDEEVAGVLGGFADDPATIIVVSANLSHDVHAAQAAELDAETERAILDGERQVIGRHHSHGRVAIRGLMCVAAERGWQVDTLARATSATPTKPASADGSQTDEPVTGYGAFVFGE